MTPLLAIDDLAVEFPTPGGAVRAVDGVSLRIAPGEILGVVGESGSGKSVTALSVLRLVRPPGRVVRGSVRFAGEDLLALPAARLRRIRGHRIAMIFQDPMTALNPVVPVGAQIAEAIRLHQPRLGRAAVRNRVLELMARVGIADPAGRRGRHPHEYSGGMRQRAMIAMALANEPDLLIADEPTTALDVTSQAQVLDLLDTARRESGASALLITHDLGVIAELADRVAVMYAGRVVEHGDVHAIFTTPRHPYTRGLLASRPGCRPTESLTPIGGSPPTAQAPPSGCAFEPRCALSAGRGACRADRPGPVTVAAGHLSACHFHEELA
ncbi:ABC transporter ATP-binding protein [Nonomuraea sp. PA05]|uniref:ABC transporter ATP-binding protein n=1 Tax=Nonomuraea sp. PA05 TaxID=2604466 RepID=UPI0011D48226|nr:ABC transporter ATP-binding protein [Nonomuraea sp. PA05]TYB57444.1 ABC transporter ATP-binding protein [Nonomuraea sp. PA05]